MTAIKKIRHRQPLTDSNLLLIITISIFAAMYALSMIFFGGGFLNPQQFLNLFNENASLIILACALSVVMIQGGIDISVGGITALVSVCCAVYLEDRGGSVLGALGLALGIGLAFGLLQGLLISFLDIQPFIITLAGMFLARGISTMVEVNPRTVKHAGFSALREIEIRLPGIGYYAKNGNFINAKIELGVIVALLVLLALFVVLKWSRFGRSLYAIGGGSQNALMLGINIRRTRLYSYMICGMLSGIAGFVYLLHTGSGSVTQATGAEMKAIASSIIGGVLLTGGVGNIIGTLFGVISLGTINNVVVAMGLKGPWWQGITTGAMLCLFIVLQSIIISNRNGGSFKLALPGWFIPKKKTNESKPPQ
ncbi:MAG: sugar ABC transporter permease YjfF [Oscillospiraceae bacterium]|jgi:simple sugar transport system permease protein|nr:sugar ABC transporter permease YjfF [Oscillospiraceae bacterium]